MYFRELAVIGSQEVDDPAYRGNSAIALRSEHLTSEGGVVAIVHGGGGIDMAL